MPSRPRREEENEEGRSHWHRDPFLQSYAEDTSRGFSLNLRGVGSLTTLHGRGLASTKLD